MLKITHNIHVHGKIITFPKIFPDNVFLVCRKNWDPGWLVSCKSALNPSVVYSTDRSKAAVPMLVLIFVALWFILRGDLFYV